MNLKGSAAGFWWYNCAVRFFVRLNKLRKQEQILC